MKRLLFGFFLVFTFCACIGGCSKNQNTANLRLNKQSLNSNFTAVLNGIEYNGQLLMKDSLTPIIKITKPQELKGFEFVCNASSVQCSFAGTNGEYIISDLPKGFAFAQVYAAIHIAD